LLSPGSGAELNRSRQPTPSTLNLDPRHPSGAPHLGQQCALVRRAASV